MPHGSQSAQGILPGFMDQSVVRLSHHAQQSGGATRHTHTSFLVGVPEKNDGVCFVLIIPLLADLLRVVAQKNPRT